MKEKIGDIIKNTYKFNNCTGDGCIFLLKSGFSYNTLNYTADKLFEFLLKRFIQRIYVQFIEDFKYYNIFIFLFSHLIIDQIRKRIEHEKYSFGLAYLTRPIRNFVVYNLLNPNAGRTDMQIKILIDYMKNIELYFAQIMKNYKEKDIILFRVSFKIAYAPFEYKKNLLSTYEDNKDVYLLEKLFSALHSYQFDYSKKYICEKKINKVNLALFISLVEKSNDIKTIRTYFNFYPAIIFDVRRFYCNIGIDGFTKDHSTCEIAVTLIFSVLLRYWKEDDTILRKELITILYQCAEKKQE